ncbi:O-methyltransferase [Longimicrobium terrae]|uniref:Putative O-methyltransferase YrrM n=1 Tax=Longimicrobium terrae TaxID=1639882 RepID=A0A841GWG8_9BACT|nr:class I SAM-dependent methyltransferase [Longimicrobium terrae]MBB4634504.1 putative O-methyltransferase YrrM [Longimicrobium terrae]MBB6068606.1 putative O-methyltransferase YrrM [Longimicrobium terrae]NNC27792.1 class I SAM-dependent methyltransferase [Longimicrobium terrae]
MTVKPVTSRSLRDASEVARGIFDTATAVGADGTPQRVHSEIRESFADALYRAVLAERPRAVVEVGMAFGIASLAILTALRELGEGGTLISIDPGQSTQWKGMGVESVRRAGLSGQHRLMETFDYIALPQLLAGGAELDFAYIDGWHTFDYTLLDFWYVDRMLRAGGVVGFNDCGMRAVHRVLRFVRTHRRYDPVDVGLPATFTGRNPLATAARRVTGRNDADQYFRKREQWEPDWNFYAPF